MSALFNFAAFQLGWFACVLGAARGWPWLGPLVVTAVIAAHLLRVPRPAPELKLIGLAVLMGVVADSLLLASGWLAYPNGLWIPGLAPYWIVAMWALFATTLNVSMRWLRSNLLLASFAGAVGGPLSYAAGARLGGLAWIEPVWALTALAMIWAAALPLLALFARRLDGTPAARATGCDQPGLGVSHGV
jgi:hypothetical protein